MLSFTLIPMAALVNFIQNTVPTQSWRSGPAELVTAAGEVNYKEELDEERMCYMFATNDTRAAEFHYAITSSFVREYMSFGENCLIYLDACNGFNEIIPGNETFRERIDRESDKREGHCM